jgi:hypothetical protein
VESKVTPRSPWLEHADFVERCDLDGICPTCGDAVTDCDGHDDTEPEPVEEL